jgi:hypothetical protein
VLLDKKAGTAKTMTSLLILPALLAKVLFVRGLAGFVIRPESFFVIGQKLWF